MVISQTKLLRGNSKIYQPSRSFKPKLWNRIMLKKLTKSLSTRSSTTSENFIEWRMTQFGNQLSSRLSWTKHSWTKTARLTWMQQNAKPHYLRCKRHQKLLGQPRHLRWRKRAPKSQLPSRSTPSIHCCSFRLTPRIPHNKPAFSNSRHRSIPGSHHSTFEVEPFKAIFLILSYWPAPNSLKPIDRTRKKSSSKRI